MKKNRLFLLACALVILLAIASRFINLEKTPGWYPDEGVNLTIAANLLKGRMSEEVVKYSFMPHPPLAFLLSLPFLLVLGSKLIALRFFSACASLGTILVLYFLGLELKNKWFGLLCAAIYTVFPLAIIVGRYGLTYQLLALLFSLVFLFLLRHFKNGGTKNLLIASILASAASITSLFGLSAVLFVLIYTLFYSRREFLKVLILSFSLFVLYICSMIIIDEQNFVSRLFITFSRSDVQSQGKTIFSDLASFFKAYPLGKWSIFYSYFFWLGPIGLLAIKGKAKWLALAYFLIIMLSELKFRGLWHYINSFGFMLCIGLASLVYFAIENPLNNKVARGALIILSVVISAGLLITSVQAINIVSRGNSFGTEAEAWYSPGEKEAKEVVAFINDNVQPTDVVMRPSAFMGDYKGRYTNPNRVLAYEENVNNPRIINNIANRSWLEYDVSFKKIKYFIDDGFYKGWLEPKDQKKILAPIYDNWSCVFQTGDIKIYHNPASDSRLLQENTKDDFPIYFLDDYIYNKQNPIQTMNRLGIAWQKRSFWFYKKNNDEYAKKIKNQAGYKVTEDDYVYVVEIENTVADKDISVSANPYWFYSPRQSQILDVPTFLGLNRQTTPIIALSNLTELSAYKNLSSTLGSTIINGESTQDLATSLAIENSPKQKVDILNTAVKNSWYLGELWQKAFDSLSLSIVGGKTYKLGFSVESQGEYVVLARVVHSRTTRSPLGAKLDNGELLSFRTDDKEGFFWQEVASGKLSAGRHDIELSNTGEGFNDIDEIFVVKKQDFMENLERYSQTIRQNKKNIYVYSAIDLMNHLDRPDVTQFWSNVSKDSYPAEANSLTLKKDQTISLESPDLVQGKYILSLNLGKKGNVDPVKDTGLKVLLNGQTVTLESKNSASGETGEPLRWGWYETRLELGDGKNLLEIKGGTAETDINLLTISPSDQATKNDTQESNIQKLSDSEYSGHIKTSGPSVLMLAQDNRVQWRAILSKTQKAINIPCGEIYQCFLWARALDGNVDITSPDIIKSSYRSAAIVVSALTLALVLLAIALRRGHKS